MELFLRGKTESSRLVDAHFVVEELWFDGLPIGECKTLRIDEPLNVDLTGQYFGAEFRNQYAYFLAKIGVMIDRDCYAVEDWCFAKYDYADPGLFSFLRRIAAGYLPEFSIKQPNIEWKYHD
jgi:hypothetical protein